MTFRDRETCEHCGHRFRTGLGTNLGTGLEATPLDAVITDEATLNRTMQFSLPPLPPRAAVAVPEAMPTDGQPPDARPMDGRTRRRIASAAALALVTLGIVGGLAYSHRAATAPVGEASPAGDWEMRLPGRPSQDARLGLALRTGGGGSFSWEAGGSAPSHPVPLRWRLDAGGKLVLDIASMPDDAVPGTLITILDSHPWLWRADRSRHRLIVGTLSFTEKT